MTFKMNLKWNLFGIFFCFFFFFFRWHLRMVFINFLHFFSIIEIWKFHQPVLPYIYCEHVLVLRIYYHTRIRKSIYIFFYYSDSYIHDWRWNSIFFQSIKIKIWWNSFSFTVHCALTWIEWMNSNIPIGSCIWRMRKKNLIIYCSCVTHIILIRWLNLKQVQYVIRFFLLGVFQIFSYTNHYHHVWW